jgi:acyl-CoA thioester hydrolase
MKKGFAAHYTVTIGDINYGGHLGNDRVFVVFQEARIRLLHSHGLQESNIGEGKGLVVVEVGCKYFKEVFLHDELEVLVSFENITGRSFTLSYSAIRLKDHKEVFTGFTKIVPFDYQLRKAARMPKSFLATFGCEES